MIRHYAWFVPFIDEANWFANAIEQAAQERPTVSDGRDWHDCIGCWGIFRETELSEETGLCRECEAMKGEE